LLSDTIANLKMLDSLNLSNKRLSSVSKSIYNLKVISNLQNDNILLHDQITPKKAF